MIWSQNVCRICGQTKQKCSKIFDVMPRGSLEGKVKKCLNLEIYEEDYKPKQICGGCLNKLDEFSSFIDLCYSTNQKFESLCYTQSSIVKETVPPKQSVIVSTRPENYQTESNITILQNVNVKYSSSGTKSVDFSVNYDITEPNGSPNYFNEYSTFFKPSSFIQVQNSVKNELISHNAENNITDSGRIISSCLVNENDCSDLLECVENSREVVSENASKIVDSKNLLISVDEIKKSVKTKNLTYSKACEKEMTKTFHLCPHCDKRFLRSSSLNAHIAVHTNIKPYKCRCCSKSFAIKTHLTQHQKIHTELYKCQYCNKKFSAPSKLIRHTRTHTNERPFVCDFLQCDSTFAEKKNLDVHRTTHSDKRNFMCNICLKLFKNKNHLSQHVKTHMSNTNFKCEICGKVYKCKRSLKCHDMALHSERTKVEHNFKKNQKFHSL